MENKDYYVLVTTTKKALYRSWANNPIKAIKNIKDLKTGRPEKVFIETINYGKKEYRIQELILK